MRWIRMQRRANGNPPPTLGLITLLVLMALIALGPAVLILQTLLRLIGELLIWIFPPVILITGISSAIWVWYRRYSLFNSLKRYAMLYHWAWANAMLEQVESTMHSLDKAPAEYRLMLATAALICVFLWLLVLIMLVSRI
jgi:hypothetical protein